MTIRDNDKVIFKQEFEGLYQIDVGFNLNVSKLNSLEIEFVKMLLQGFFRF